MYNEISAMVNTALLPELERLRNTATTDRAEHEDTGGGMKWRANAQSEGSWLAERQYLADSVRLLLPELQMMRHDLSRCLLRR